jgi:hypothetical protein
MFTVLTTTPLRLHKTDVTIRIVTPEARRLRASISPEGRGSR